ncbi:hypothetical protein RKE29_11630 [Streptomyces sp. B1866]|uniref:hypothetical protein n=1 Tax=Streptomyces sp. B1866 TaxID=3075431 RepID=UPI00288EF6B8|nr:hypothetical protein [Streptomyces sp. B1866]MDT3397289.1 hypothetical protein [Streptomyces sp. B1866]
MTDPHPSAYEVHYGRRPSQLIFGAGWKRYVALRVDSTGLTLGGVPIRHRAHTAVIPWEDLTAIVLWRQHVSDVAPGTALKAVTATDTLDYIGVRLRPGVQTPPGPNRKISPKRAARFAPHIDYELAVTSHPIVVWRPDVPSIRAAVHAFAPHVPVEDLRDTR